VQQLQTLDHLLWNASSADAEQQSYPRSPRIEFGTTGRKEARRSNLMRDQACAGSMLGKEVFSGGGYKAVLFSACSLVLSVLHRIHSFSCQTLSYYFVTLLFFVSQFSYYNISTRTNKSFVSFGHPGLHPLCPIPPVSCLKLTTKSELLLSTVLCTVPK